MTIVIEPNRVVLVAETVFVDYVSDLCREAQQWRVYGVIFYTISGVSGFLLRKIIGLREGIGEELDVVLHTLVRRFLVLFSSKPGHFCGNKLACGPGPLLCGQL